MLNGNKRPTEEEIENTIGENSFLWSEIQEYLEENYDFVPELVYYGKKYGWTICYRKGGKTLCSLFPEQGAFTVLVVLSRKEVEKTYTMIDGFHSKVRSLFENAEQLRDGRWLWIRILRKDDIQSLKLLLNTKRKPKKHNQKVNKK